MNRLIKKTILAIVFLLGIANSGDAQILYKISKDGASKESYILGTHHFAPLSIVDSICELPSILSKVDKVYGEIDMSSMTDPAIMMKMQSALAAPADSTLDKLLPPAQLDSLATIWNEYSNGMIPLEMLYGMKPAILGIQLTSMMTQKVFPEINPLEGIDITMQNRARKLGKKVEGLEDMDFQINLLYNVPISDQVENLISMMRNIEDNEKKAVAISKAYASHDINEILNLTIAMENEDAEAADRLIYSRNSEWVEKIGEEMNDESMLIVVGAAHLPGEKGVLEGLRKKGFSIESIN